LGAESTSKTLYLIDGHGQFFRAFHAIRTPMTSPVTKEPTNATFGFVGMLLKVLRQYKPDYLAVAIDVSGDKETFRSEIYPEYKAHRDEPPETLWPQVERCVSLLKEIGVPVLGVEGVEADDVMATLATRLTAKSPGLKVRLISKDKDLQQVLAQDRVEMFDVHTDELLDEARLKAEKGITPSQVIDMLALMGDTVDNVPGVAGVGPKTAAELIAQYGSVDNLLAHIGEIKGKRGENLRAGAGVIPLSKQLVTLKLDVPVDFELREAEVAALRLAPLGPILKELGFNRYQEELKALIGGASAASGPASDEQATRPRGERLVGGLFEQGAAPRPVGGNGGSYSCIRTRAELDSLVSRMRAAPVFAFDTETTGLSPLRCKLCGVSISVKAGEGFYIPVRSPESGAHLDAATVLSALRSLLEDPARAKCGHNIKYDMLVLRNSGGIEVRGAPGTFFDSMVSSYLIDSSRSSHGLDALALGLLNHTNIPISDLIGTGKNQRSFEAVPLDQATPYAGEDADISLRLRDLMAPQLRAMGLASLFDDVEMPLVEVLTELEWNGILVDPEELDRQAARLNKRIEELRRQIIDAAPVAFNPDSPKQLAAVLFNKPTDDPPGLGIKPLKKTKTGHSTDVEVLEKLATDATITSPVPGLIVEYRQLTKLVGTYLSALKDEINPVTKRIHTSFSQTVAATGRLASSDPNLQNIPIRTDIGREIRKAFIAPPERVLISADYSQVELRLLAHLSRDPALTEAFHRGDDIHTAVAAQIHGVPLDKVTREQRNGAKMVNFGIVYGVTPYGLARRLAISNDEAAAIIDGYKKRFAGITTFLQECIEQARRFGYVQTILKRRRPIQWIDSRNPSERSLAERIAINSVVQGSAADLIKLAMIDLHARLSEHAPHRRPAEIGGQGAPPQFAGVKMLLQIHDELLFEAPQANAAAVKDLVVARMEEAMTLDVPLKVDASISADWFGGKG